ncbi:proline dehydrogenase [Streptomyces sp. NBC_01260]|uniref:proline dehydrogenase n=1 Tax=unclassified Streptomyces TaxID=2593676 RepID=UPI000F49D05D|nr:MULTISPECIES: proline dehydrogenase [unclassified Streptomyces]MCX4772176.1 proline dehydrogenase [Streptomyces sp. NBC_01285]
MDAGIAALLGAAVGSFATIGAAMVNGRATARSQFRQSRRQHRRDAYANYLGALHDRDIAMDAVLGALQPGTPDLLDVDEKVHRFVELARDVHRAVEVVSLEGPPSIVEAADRVAHASGDLSNVMRRMVKNAHSGDSSQKVVDTALAAEREHALYQAVKGFRAAAGDVLGNAN